MWCRAWSCIRFSPPSTKSTFSVLLCGLLRAHGIPARARCGFARYFVPGRGEDDWVCETWSAADSRWVLVDAQLDSVQQAAFQTSLDPLDVSRDDFLPGGLVWSQCRSGAADWSEFGLSVIHESGVRFVVGDFVRDVAALNKVELLPWDSWGVLTEGSAGEDRFSLEPEPMLRLPPRTMSPSWIVSPSRRENPSTTRPSARHTRRTSGFECHGTSSAAGPA